MYVSRDRIRDIQSVHGTYGSSVTCLYLYNFAILGICIVIFSCGNYCYEIISTSKITKGMIIPLIMKKYL